MGGGRSILDDMVGVGDMVLLDPLTEDAVMENLWERYNSKDIYVSTVDIQYNIILILDVCYTSLLLCCKHNVLFSGK